MPSNYGKPEEVYSITANRSSSQLEKRYNPESNIKY